MVLSEIKEGVSSAYSEVTDTLYDTYTYNPPGPIPSIRWGVEKVLSKIPEPQDRVWLDDMNKGAGEVSVFAKTDAAFDRENFVSMFDRHNFSPFDGNIKKGERKSKILAPFSLYTPTSIWPYQDRDGSRYTVHDFASKDIGIPDVLENPIKKLMQIDLDIDQDDKSDWGGLPLFNWIADPLMGIGPILLLILIGYIGATVIPMALPIIGGSLLPF